jgi:hypothetical protein
MYAYGFYRPERMDYWTKRSTKYMCSLVAQEVGGGIFLIHSGINLLEGEEWGRDFVHNPSARYIL